MPYYFNPKKNINVLLFHIPKTGGTSIEDYLKKERQSIIKNWLF